jgi:hypothetical protein
MIDKQCKETVYLTPGYDVVSSSLSLTALSSPTTPMARLRKSG